MNMAISLAVEKPETRRGRKAVRDLVDTFDNLMEEYGISPVTWIMSEEGPKLVFKAYIPADCMPEYDEAADHIASCFRDLCDYEEAE